MPAEELKGHVPVECTQEKRPAPIRIPGHAPFLFLKDAKEGSRRIEWTTQKVADRLMDAHNRGTRIVFRIASDLMRNRTADELRARVIEAMKTVDRDSDEDARALREEFLAFKQKTNTVLAAQKKTNETLRSRLSKIEK
jgi:hypothetical protein